MCGIGFEQLVMGTDVERDLDERTPRCRLEYGGGGGPGGAWGGGGGGSPMADRAMADEQAAAPPSAPEPRSAPARRTSTLAQLRRDENGLTTLEWLLIVAAVAGLAALAVVLVTNVVSDTSEQIAGGSARLASADAAAADITTRARAETPADDDAAVALNTEYKRKCELLKVSFSDIDGIKAIWSKDIVTNPAKTPPEDPEASSALVQGDWDATDPIGCWVGN